MIFGRKIATTSMPLTPKGRKIEHAMEKEYGDKKGKSVFYASINKGKVTGAEKSSHEKAMRAKSVGKSLKGKYEKEEGGEHFNKRNP